MMQRAANFRMRIDGAFYAVFSVRFADGVTPVPVSNSESVPGNPNVEANLPGFTSTIPDLREGQVEIEAYYDPENSPFTTPIPFVAGTYHTIEGFPAGEGEEFYDVTNVLLVRIEHTSRIPGAQTFRSVWQTDGSYILPQGL